MENINNNKTPSVLREVMWEALHLSFYRWLGKKNCLFFYYFQNYLYYFSLKWFSQKHKLRFLKKKKNWYMIKKTNSNKINRKMQREPLQFESESDANIDPLCYQFLFINLYGLRIIQNSLLVCVWILRFTRCIFCVFFFLNTRLALFIVHEQWF